MISLLIIINALFQKLSSLIPSILLFNSPKTFQLCIVAIALQLGCEQCADGGQGYRKHITDLDNSTDWG